MLYVVSSNIRYRDPLASLLEQLRAAGIPPENVWVTVSQSDNVETYRRDGVTFSHVKENCYEYTALLDIARRDLEFDYAFLLHDTCQVGPRLHELVSAQPVTVPWDYMPVARTGQFNIGLYRRQFLRDCLPKLEALKGITKREAVQIENNRCGRGFKCWASISTNFLDGRAIHTGYHSVYNSDVYRVGIYLPGADIHKFWGRFRKTPTGWKKVWGHAHSP
jgi:hypothetical protein